MEETSGDRRKGPQPQEIHGPDDMLGEVVGDKYRLLERLDNRGHARVYRAEQLHVGRTVALKLANWHLGPDDPAIKRLAWAAQVAAIVEHPSVATVYDLGTDGTGHVYLAMELCRGQELGQLVAGQGPLEPDLAVEVTRQILQGLVVAHRRGVIHQALRPRYVMVDLEPPSGDRKVQVKLLGFGLGDWGLRMAESFASEKPTALSGLSRTGELDASGFAAPEVLQGGNIDHRADLYSVGVLLVHALTGKLPWQRLASADLPSRRWYEQSLHRILKGLPGYRAWRNFFATALNPDPARRFDHAEHMLDALERAAAGHSDEVSQVAQLQLPFGRYRLIRMLAQGGMGELHLAKAEPLPGLPRVFAIKMLRPELAAEKKFMEGFLEEAKLTSRLFHPNVLSVHEVGKVEDRFYMAMEYVVGKDCRRILARAREDNLPIPVEVALYIIREVAEALAYAHRIETPKGTGLVHADVSPPNIVVSYEGAVKLIDFGLAKQMQDSRETSRDALMGKLAYMSPEQSRNERLDGRTDIYSAALVLFELLTSERFHTGDSPSAIALSVHESTFKPASRLNPAVPGPVDRILNKGLNPDRDDRYETAEAFRNDLAEVLARMSPRMSCDRVGAYVRALFPAELKAETDLAMSLHSRAPTASLETAITDEDRVDLGPGWMDDLTGPTLETVSPNEPTDPRAKVPPRRSGKRIDAMARTVASMPGVRPEDYSEDTDADAVTEPGLVPGESLPPRRTAPGRKKDEMDETLPPFATPWHSPDRPDSTELKAAEEQQAPKEAPAPEPMRPKPADEDAAQPEPTKTRSPARRFLLTAMAALAIGGGAGAVAAFLFMRTRPETPASSASTAGQDRAAGQNRAQGPTAPRPSPRRPDQSRDPKAASATRTGDGGSPSSTEGNGPNGGANPPAADPLSPSGGRAGTATQTTRADRMLQKAAAEMERQGLRPEELPIFPKLFARYQTWTRAARSGNYKDAEKLMTRWLRLLGSRGCNRYLAEKLKWIKKRVRSRKLNRNDRKRLARQYSQSWSEARKKAPGCVGRSIRLSPVVRGLMDALGKKAP